MEKEKTVKKKTIVFYAIFSILFFVLCLMLPVLKWYGQTFGVSIQEILYTMNSPLKGADASFIWDAVKYCIPFAIYEVLFIFILIKTDSICFIREDVSSGKINLHRLFVIGCILILVFLLAADCVYADKKLSISEYIRNRTDRTTIYEDKYVNPDSVTIKAPEKKKNLLYIYVESLETTLASKEEGGFQSENYIPNMTEIAKENISFSDGNKLGGFHNNTGTTWTMGSIFGTSTGVPFAFPVEGNSMGKFQKFAGGIKGIGEILEENGYHNEFLCGSDAEFAGRKDFYVQHGNYEIFDYYTAIDKGYIAEDYFVWWGFEDRVLYEIAKDELVRLYDAGKPFNLTMLTVDLHHVGGYTCEFCEDRYENSVANVASCTDRQLSEFLKWCQEQDFYKDTVIVIIGDHPRMDNMMVETVDFYDRTMYNCFMNVDKEEGSFRTENVEWSPLDMFPTVLSALDFEIEGDRLGLGTDLFSRTETYTQSMGYYGFNEELKKYSQYYVDTFS